MSHRICGAKRDNAECGLLSSQALQHIVDGAVTAAGNDRIESIANGHAHLRRSVGCSASGSDVDLNARRLQDGSSCFDVGDPVFATASRERIVEKGGAMHASRL